LLVVGDNPFICEYFPVCARRCSAECTDLTDLTEVEEGDMDPVTDAEVDVDPVTDAEVDAALLAEAELAAAELDHATPEDTQYGAEADEGEL
jgi:hypothetical protein